MTRIGIFVLFSVLNHVFTPYVSMIAEYLSNFYQSDNIKISILSPTFFLHKDTVIIVFIGIMF